MKTKKLVSALNKILKPVKTIEGNLAYIVGNKRIVVIDQDGNGIALPMINTEIVHNGKYTIRNLIGFITNELNDEEIEYLKTLKKMYATTPNDRLVEMASSYHSL